jgi:hypothetical protein
MTAIGKYRLAISLLAMTIACHDSSLSKLKRDQKYPLILTISFAPSFNERSEINMVSSDSTQTIQILLRDYRGDDKSRDTFYFKKIDLTNKQHIELE